ncbi:MAG: glycosyltransferase family 39 protein [Anaerolineales bacterium]
MFKKFFALIIDKSKKAMPRFGKSKAGTPNANDDPKDTNTNISATPESQPGQPEATPQTSPSPWKFPDWQTAFLLLFSLTIGVILFLRLFQLDTLQAEVYGDIDIVLKYMRGILAGEWPVNFVLSAGPLYHYLIAPIALFTGVNYTGMKVASAIVSLAGLAALYAFSRRLINDYFALLALFIAGVSSWLLVFSRLGNSQIALPLLTMLALWLVVRIVQFGRLRDVIACALVSGLGLFLYPQSFIMPGVIFVTLLCLGWAKQPLPKNWVVTFILASIPCVILFVLLVVADPSNFNGYVVHKIQPEGSDNALVVLAGNIGKAALALHVRGDEGFRSNPSTLPHLDWVSGILFLVGVVFWLVKKERRRWVPLWLVPFLLLQVPSILVINQPAEVPSASRTLGVAPIAYILVASGLWWLIQVMYTRKKYWLTATIAGLFLGSILLLNAQRYFQTYIDGLPYSNTPIGRSVAMYANSLPDETQVYMIGCCWEYGMPENFVQYEMTRPPNLHYYEPNSLSCELLKSIPLPAVFVWSFHNDLPAAQLELCKQWLSHPQRYTYQSRPIFNAAPLDRDSGPIAAESTGPNQLDETLIHDMVQLDGQTVQVEYSPIDMGSIGDLFDGNTDSLIRGNGANPMKVVLHFSPPRKVSTVDLTTGSMTHFHVTIIVVYTDNSSQSVDKDYQNLPDDPHISIPLPASQLEITSLHVLVQDMNAPADDVEHIHLRELKIQ